jgi:hypothetical protein
LYVTYAKGDVNIVYKTFFLKLSIIIK